MSARRSLGAALVVLLALGSAGCSAFGLDTAPEPGAHGGSAIVVGVSGDFAENQLVAEMYAQVLEHAGYDVRREFDLHSRESSQNALESGTIDVKPEYLSSLLLFMDPNAEASEDPDEVAAIRRSADPRPWAAGARELYVRLRWDELTGRRLGHGWTHDNEMPVRRQQ